jgi:hypothetical protein
MRIWEYFLVAIATLFAAVHILALTQENKLLLIPVRKTKYDKFIPQENCIFLPLKTGGLLVQMNLKCDPNKRSLLFCHGNSGNIDGFFALAESLKDQYNFFFLEYAGYGICHTLKEPTGKSLLLDLTEAWSLIPEPQEAILVGFSMGGGCICQFLAKAEESVMPKQIMLINSYYSLPQLVQELLPVSLLGHLMSTQWHSETGLRKYKNGHLVVVATQDDELIPLRHSEQMVLIAKETGVPTQHILLANGGHNGSIFFHLPVWKAALIV